MEDYLQLERAVQTYAGYHYADRLHAVTHVHNEPLVPRRRIRGVRDRISFFGEEVIPLYEQEAEQAVRELLDLDITSLCISLLYCYRDPRHENKIADIARREIEARGLDIPVFTSSTHSPVRGDLARLNTLLVELYAARPSRQQLLGIRARLESELGSHAPVRVLTSYGGTISPEHRSPVSTIVSGPIGGLIGGDRITAELYGGINVVCTDVGGTSFDVGLISERVVATRTEPMVARMLLALPHVAMDSIGAGTGTRIRVDQAVQRVVLGPDSAGSRIGVCWEPGGETVPSLTDCDVVLGYLNPEYFLGGELELDVDRASRATGSALSYATAAMCSARSTATGSARPAFSSATPRNSWKRSTISTTAATRSGWSYGSTSAQAAGRCWRSRQSRPATPCCSTSSRTSTRSTRTSSDARHRTACQMSTAPSRRPFRSRLGRLVIFFDGPGRACKSLSDMRNERSIWNSWWQAPITKSSVTGVPGGQAARLMTWPSSPVRG